MPNSPGVAQDETLSEVAGFLEACQLRMNEIIEAGARGVLPAETFAVTLAVNEELTAALDAERDFRAVGKHPSKQDALATVRGATGSGETPLFDSQRLSLSLSLFF